MISSEVIHSFLHTRKSKIKSWFIINWRQSVVIKRNRLLIHVNSQDFSSGHVWMWQLDCEESWAPKNWCFWTVVLEKTLESPLDCKEIQPVHSKGNQSWDFFGRTDAKAETPVLWPPHAKSWLIRKDSDAGRDWGQEEKGTTEDEMVGSPCSPRDSQDSPPTPQFKSINSLVLSLLHSPTLTSIHDHRKNHSLD